MTTSTPASQGQYAEITKKCFINAPFDQLRDGDLLPLFLENKLQPEIGLEGNALWNLPMSEFQTMADHFQDNDLQCTLHAPFFDLSPGGFDQRVVERAASVVPISELLPT